MSLQYTLTKVSARPGSEDLVRGVATYLAFVRGCNDGCLALVLQQQVKLRNFIGAV